VWIQVLVRKLQRETFLFGMSPKFHSVPCQGHHAITGPGDSTDLDVKKCGLSDGQIKPGCEKGFGASSSERMARKALFLLSLCVNCVA
jgi:hypothetical protein